VRGRLQKRKDLIGIVTAWFYVETGWLLFDEANDARFGDFHLKNHMRGILGVFLVATALGFIPKYSNNLHKTRRAALVSATFKPSLLRSSSLYSSSLDIDGVQSDGPSLTPSGFGFTTSLRRIIELNAGKVKTPDKSYGFVKVLSTNSVDEVMGKVYSDCTGEVGGYVALVFDEQDNLAGIFTDRDYLEFTKMRDSEKMTLEQSSIFTTQPVSKYMTPAERLIIANSEVPAGEALKIMNANKFRHLIVGKDKRVPTFVLGDRGPLSSDGLCAVVSMADIMRQVQIDERLSLSKLQQKFPSYKYDPVRQLQEEQKSFANEMAKEPGVGKKDIIRAGTTAVILGVFATFLFSSPWLASHAELGLIGIFVLGYVGIIFEELFEFNKAGVALLMSTAMWITYADFFEQVNGQMAAKAGDTVLDQLKDQLAEVSDICFFLLAASTIVEVVDAHQGFKTITNRIPTENRVQLFWIIGILTFFLSSILNNLTVTIVMISLLRKIIPVEDERRLFGAMVVVAANAGGVWTPIGDVTTTMLWINGNLSTLPTITQLALPSIACLVTSLAFLVRKLDDAPRISAAMSDDSSPIPVANVPPPPSTVAPRGQLVFTFGILSLLSVPVFSELTGLPPYLAMLTGLGAMWTLTDAIHMDEDGREGLKVPAALSKLDTSGILFFLGILMSIGGKWAVPTIAI